jgi:hypothetical protein
MIILVEIFIFIQLKFRSIMKNKILLISLYLKILLIIFFFNN